jgi:hypothetical protein
MSWLRRREISIIFFFIPAFLIFINFFTGQLEAATGTLFLWVSTLTSFAFILGTYIVFSYHFNILYRQSKEWIYSIVFMIALFSMILMYYLYPGGYDIMVFELATPTWMAVQSYVGIYSYTLFYRASATKSAMVGILTLFMALALLFNIPMRDVIWPGFGTIGRWVAAVPSSGGMNALKIGIAIGIIALFIRALLGYEESFLGGRA